MTLLRSHPNPLLNSWALPADVQKARLRYRVMRNVLRLTVTAAWKVRVFNRHFEPPTGGAIYICNHQSFLDPILMSFALQRPMNYMARDSLFRFPVFKQIISGFNAFPVKRGSADLGALKEAMRRLKDGGQVVVFAEGTRTPDARIAPFLPGVAMLAQRAAAWTVPVVIDGAYEAWPRTQTLPGGGSVVVQYAPPIPQADARTLKPEQFIQQVRQSIIDMQTEVRRRVGRSPLDYSLPFAPADSEQGDAE